MSPIQNPNIMVATRDVFYPVQTAVFGTETVRRTWERQAVYLDAAGETAYMSAFIPWDFNEIVMSRVLTVPIHGSGFPTFDYTINTSYGAPGTSPSTHTGTVTADGRGLSDTRIDNIRAEDAMSSLAALDLIGVSFVLDAITGDMNGIDILGFHLSYT